jgi:ABC-type dipeptide/oligopeptide/nickel transport system permease subunit
MLGAMGVSDLLVPTWGMLLRENLANGLAGTPSFMLLAPMALLLLLGLSFTLVGVGLDRVLNPRTREI